MKNTKIVTYHNLINQITFKNFQKRDYDFFMALCSQLRDQDTKKIILTFKEIKELSNYNLSTKNERFISELKRMNEKLKSISSTIETENKISMFVLFHTFDIDKDEQTLTVSVNEKFKFLFNDLNREFTELDLKIFTSLKSRYSKALYRKLKQFRFTGFYIVKINELQQVLDVPKSFSPNKIITRAINPAIDELKEYFPGLHVVKDIDTTRGNPITGFAFKFKKQQTKNTTTDATKKNHSKSNVSDAVSKENFNIEEHNQTTQPYDATDNYFNKLFNQEMKRNRENNCS